MGSNDSGQLGTGDYEGKNVPTQVIDASVVDISVGDNHAVALMEDGSVWGSGGLSDSSEFTPIVEDVVVTRIAAGMDYLLYLLDDGSLWAMGGNDSGQLGTGNYNASTEPVLVLDENVTEISAEIHSLIRLDDGRLLAAGPNHYGQLGTGNPSISVLTLLEDLNSSAVFAGRSSSFIVMNDHSLWAMGVNDDAQLGFDDYENRYELAQISFDHNISEISSGASHSFIIADNGSLWGAGYNGSGKLASQDDYLETFTMIREDNVSAVAAGTNHSLWIDDNGSLWAIGDNSYGQLGTGDYEDRNAPALIREANVSAISAGSDHSLWIDDNGSLWAMGKNSSGQLGTGDYEDRNTSTLIREANVSAVFAGENHTFFIDNNGSLWAMGKNSSGQLGASDYENKNLPTLILEGNVSTVATGESHSLVRMNDGTVYITGASEGGQLGFRHSTPDFTEVTDGLPSADDETEDGQYYILNLYVNGQPHGELEVERNNSELRVEAVGSSFMGALSELTWYQPAISAEQVAEQHRLTSTPQIEPYDFTPLPSPLSFSADTDLVLDELRIVDTALSERQIAQLAQNDLSRNARTFSLAHSRELEVGPLLEVESSSYDTFQNAFDELQAAEENFALAKEARDNAEAAYEEANANWLELDNDENENIRDAALATWQDANTTYDSNATVRQDANNSYNDAKTAWEAADTALDTKEQEWAEIGRVLNLADVAATTSLENPNTHFFVAKWGQDGSLENLSHSFGSGEGQNSSANAILPSEEDEAYVAGHFGANLLWMELNVSGENPVANAFIAKVDDQLSPRWVTAIQETEESSVFDLAYDRFEDIQAVGYFEGNASLDHLSVSSAGGKDAFMLKINPLGSAISLDAHGGTADEKAVGLGTDAYGGTVIGGTIEGDGQSVFFGDANFTLLSAGGKDGFLLRHDYYPYIPRNRFEVTVDQVAGSGNRYFIDGVEAPDLELIRGLTYTFALDGSSTSGHPFYFSELSTGGNSYSSEYTEGVSNSRATEGEIIFYASFDAPNELYYACGLHDGMGAKILLPGDERPRSTLSFAAIDSGSNYIEGGDWNVTNEQGSLVRNGQSVLSTEWITLMYTPPDGYLFAEWTGDIPEDINRTRDTLILPMSEDRAIQAVVAAYAPNPLELANLFWVEFTIQPTDEQGEPVLSDDPLITYTAKFNVDANASPDSGTGSYSIARASNLDINEDGDADAQRGDFSYTSGSEEAVSVTMENLEGQFANNGNWQSIRGGGFVLTLSVAEVNGSEHSGDYFILFDDGTTESGTWTSDNIRNEPVSKGNKP